MTKAQQIVINLLIARDMLLPEDSDILKSSINLSLKLAREIVGEEKE